MKKIFVLFLFLIFLEIPVFANEVGEFNAKMTGDFSSAEFPETIKVKNVKDIRYNGKIIPKNALITLKIQNVQRALRWHKSGFFLCRALSFEDEFDQNVVDISDSGLYFIAKPYEKLQTKDVILTGTEITLTQVVSFFAPGTDILYFFTKGAIQREKHNNWFKAGVFNAYDNSIFWFPQKGKSIELTGGDDVIIKPTDEKEFEKLNKKVQKRRDNEYVKAELKNCNAEIRRIKRETAQLKKNDLYYETDALAEL